MEKKEVKSFFGKPTPLGEVLESFLKKQGLFPKFILLFYFLVLGSYFPK